MIVDKQGGNPRADYGDGLLKELSIQLTKDFGKGFDESNLRRIRQFYILFPKRATVWHELSWTHYKSLMRVEDINARNFYINEAIRFDYWFTNYLRFKRVRKPYTIVNQNKENNDKK